jgi:hypothetical protein
MWGIFNCSPSSPAITSPEEGDKVGGGLPPLAHRHFMLPRLVQYFYFLIYISCNSNMTQIKHLVRVSKNVIMFSS